MTCDHHSINVIGALGMDCTQLGFGVTNKSSSSPPSLPDNSKSIGKHKSMNVAVQSMLKVPGCVYI